MDKAIVITVGTGKNREDIAHGICFSIRNQNPDYILFLVSKISDKETMPFILENSSMQNKKYDIKILSDVNDIEKIKIECQNYIKEVIYKGYEPKDLVIDYTSGTKAMSSGLTLAALDLKAGILSYVTGNRDDTGRVITGTERLIILEPNKVIADSLFKDAISFFNKYQYEASLKVIDKAKNLYHAFDFQEKISLLEKLSNVYLNWDKFNIKKAYKNLSIIPKDKILYELGIKDKIKENKEALLKENDNKFCYERIADLLENAKRRGDIENKYDDAVARLYRLIEYLAQYKLDELGLDTNDIDLEKIPYKLRNKYEKNRDQKDGKIKLGLYESYELLSDLGEELGERFLTDYKNNKSELKKLLYIRNYSILAHGLSSVTEKNYKKILNFIKDFAEFLIPDLSEYIKKVKFPEINLR